MGEKKFLKTSNIWEPRIEPDDFFDVWNNSIIT